MKKAIIASFIFAATAAFAGQNGVAHSGNQNSNGPQYGSSYGQGQGQQSSNANTNVLSNRAGSKSVSKAAGGNAKQQQSNQSSGNAAVSVEGSHYQEARRPVETAYAAGLVVSQGTCLGSASGGVQGASLGVSFGSTKQDAGCHLIRRMDILAQLGMPDAAVALACAEDPAIREALTATGRRCSEGGRVVHHQFIRESNIPAPQQDRN